MIVEGPLLSPLPEVKMPAMVRGTVTRLPSTGRATLPLSLDAYAADDATLVIANFHDRSPPLYSVNAGHVCRSPYRTGVTNRPPSIHKVSH